MEAATETIDSLKAILIRRGDDRRHPHEPVRDENGQSGITLRLTQAEV